MAALEFIMIRREGITLKNINKILISCVLALAIVIFISNWLNYVSITKYLSIAYVVVSLVFSISAFMLLLRYFKITSENNILMRFVAIIGAVISCCIWLCYANT